MIRNHRFTAITCLIQGTSTASFRTAAHTTLGGGITLEEKQSAHFHTHTKLTDAHDWLVSL